MRYLIATMLLNILLKPIHLAEDRSKWEDPNDMISFDHGSMKMVKREAEPEVVADMKVTDNQNTTDSKQCQTECPVCVCPSQEFPTCAPPVECSCEQAALPLLKKYTLTLLNHLNGQMPVDKAEQYSAHITLSADDIKIFEKFVNVENKHHVHDVHEILSRMIRRVTSSRPDKLEQWAQLIEHKIGLSLDRLIQFVTLAAMASVVLLIEIQLQIAWRRRITQLLVLMFVISVPWTWFDLYKEAEIKQETKGSKTFPEDCKSDNSYWKHIVSMVTLQEDKCMQYYESVMVDPLVKVPPTKAIAVTFVRFFVAPLKDVGTAVSEFIRALLIDLPVTLYPVAFLMVALFLFLFLVFIFGYSVRLPLGLLTIERNPQVAVMDNRVHLAVADASQQSQSQLEHLQAKLEMIQSQMLDRLQHLEQVQQLAIEYSQSFSVPSPTGSPTIPIQIAATSKKQARNPVVELGVHRQVDKGPVQQEEMSDNDTRRSTSDLEKFSVDEEGQGDKSSESPNKRPSFVAVDTLTANGVQERLE